MHSSTFLFVIISVFKFRCSAESLFNNDLYASVLDNVTCERNLLEMNYMQFFDASGRLPQSITLGGQGSLGNYRQCLAIAQQRPNETIFGKYCIVNVPLNFRNSPATGPVNNTFYEVMNSNETGVLDTHFLKIVLGVMTGDMRTASSTGIELSINIAVCVPESCSAEDVIDRVDDFLNLTIKEKYCRLPNDKVFSAVDYVAVTFIIILGTLTLLSTGYDLYNVFILGKTTGKLQGCCSIYTNTTRLITFTSTPGAIECLDGIRALSILMVVLGHSFLNIFTGYVVNPLTEYKWVMSLNSIWLTSALLSVDTFLMMSGLLVVYTTAKKLSPLSLMRNIHLFYLHRLLRMFPLLAATVLLQASLVHHVADGPRWPALSSSIQSCREWWWSALLHVQNYVNPTKLCLSQTWYLSVDIQLHIISPLVLFWVLRSRRSAWVGLTTGLLVSLISAAIYCYVKNFNHSFMSIGQNMNSVGSYFKQYYVNTLTRAPAFFVGMVFGYILSIRHERLWTLPKWVNTVGWITALVLGSTMIYFNSPSVNVKQFWMNFLNTFMRPIWALCVGWMVFACSEGSGGPLNWFLSLTVWKFIARVSYALYLVHYPLQSIMRAQSDMPFMFSLTSSMYWFLSEVTLSVLVATLMCILVDAPFSTLQKVLFTVNTKSVSVKESTNGATSSTETLVA